MFDCCPSSRLIMLSFISHKRMILNRNSLNIPQASSGSKEFCVGGGGGGGGGGYCKRVGREGKYSSLLPSFFPLPCSLAPSLPHSFPPVHTWQKQQATAHVDVGISQTARLPELKINLSVCSEFPLNSFSLTAFILTPKQRIAFYLY